MDSPLRAVNVAAAVMLNGWDPGLEESRVFVWNFIRSVLHIYVPLEASECYVLEAWYFALAILRLPSQKLQPE